MKKPVDINFWTSGKKQKGFVGLGLLVLFIITLQGCSSSQTESEDDEEEEVSDVSDTSEGDDSDGDVETASTDEVTSDADASELGAADKPTDDGLSSADSLLNDPLASNLENTAPAIAEPMESNPFAGISDVPSYTEEEKPKKKLKTGSKRKVSSSGEVAPIQPLQANTYEQPVAQDPVAQPQFQMPASRTEVPPVEPVAQNSQEQSYQGDVETPSQSGQYEQPGQQGRTEIRETASEEETPWYKNFKVLGSLLILGGAGGYAALQMKKRKEI